MQLHQLGNYNTLRIGLLKQLEGDYPWAYVDTKGIPTFGIGLSLEAHGLLVLQALGFDLGGQRLIGAALTQERLYADRLIALFNQTYTSSTLESNQAKQAFDAILQERVAYFSQLNYDPGNFISQQAYDDFQFNLIDKNEFRIDDPLVRENLTTMAFDGYSVPNLEGGIYSDNGYEAIVDDWLERTGLDVVRPELNFLDSRERLALLSLAYNSKTSAVTGLPTTLGGKLAKALRNDDRAEAWFEIRYNTNAEWSGGIARRRYIESEMFSLYDEGVNAWTINDDQAKSVYRMFTRHRADTIYGNNGMIAYDTNYAGNLSNANTEARLIGLDGVGTLQQEFEPAYTYLINTYNTNTGITIDWHDISVAEKGGDILTGIIRDGNTYGTGIEVNDLMLGSDMDDVLLGGGGSDVLHGGGGNDYLEGGIGDDHLNGGSGHDIYVINAGEGNDVIDDYDDTPVLYTLDKQATGTYQILNTDLTLTVYSRQLKKELKWVA